MSIEIKTEEGAVFKFGTVEGFQAFVDAVKSEDAKAEVDMENLPIGTLVKVVDNRAGHWHEEGEILPITEVVEGNLSEMYRLDGRTAGWVSVNDIEFVSFPEEEDSTSGDEGFEEEDSEKYPAVGTKVKAKYGESFRTEGKVYEVLDVQKGEYFAIKVSDDVGRDGYHPNHFCKIFEILKPSEEDSEIKLGDRVRLIDADDPYRVNVPVGTEGTVTGRDFDGDYEVDFEYTYVKLNQTAGIDQIEKVPEDSEIKAGDIVIATEAEFDITEGVEYEIREYRDGHLYFLDDAGDVRHVSFYEKILRKKIIDEPKIEVGDILRCNKDSMYVTEGKLYEVLAIDRDGDAVYMDDGNSVSYVNETDIPERFEIL